MLPDLRAFARFLARDTAAADDLVQEAIVRALRAEAQWDPERGPEGAAGPDPEASLRAWMFRILRNVFLETMRRRGTERRAMEQMPLPDTAPPAAQEARHAVSDLARALAHLPLAQREALILVGAHGLSHEEAAQVCNVPVGTMKARVARARAALARQVGDMPAEAERSDMS
ncbi:sigma-70 family RNA polymerase sigma factor [Pseudoroseomonas globiformis]|uniref:Sigma-70 family RNA polymerase sigma factor n=1 Tax=Teichococcus globiformis TaxID=2307229 RepID=A0ABV7FZD2_9PROT